MRYNEVAIWLCDPVTLKVLYKFKSISQCAKALEVTRQAIHDDLKKNHLAGGYRVTTPDAYEQLRG